LKLKTKKMAKRFKKAEDYDFVFACCSGGKDSTVSAYLSSLFVPAERLYVLHYSSDWSFPGTRQQVEEMCRELGLNLIITTPDDDLEECLTRYGPPSILNRWCTRKIKIEPSRKAVNMFPAERILFVDGSRSEESRSRSSLKPYNPGGFVDGHDVIHPIYDWGERRVWRVIRRCGLPIHPVYQWSRRLSCYPCPLQSKGSWLCLRRHYPELWEKALMLESSIDSPWLMNYQWLRDLKPEEHEKGLEDPVVMVRRWKENTKEVVVQG